MDIESSETSKTFETLLSFEDELSQSLITDYFDDDKMTSPNRSEKLSDPENTYLEDISSWGEPPQWVFEQNIRDYLIPITFDYLRFNKNKILIWNHEEILSLRLSKKYNIKSDYFSPTNQQELQDFLLKNKYIKVKDEDKISRGFRPIEAGILCGGCDELTLETTVNFIDDESESSLESPEFSEQDSEQESSSSQSLQYVESEKTQESQESEKSQESQESEKGPQQEFIIIISAPNRRGDPGRLYILTYSNTTSN